MMKSSNMDKRVPVFLNFQLTEKRAALAKAVRKAKSEERLAGYSVDQNGKIKIKKVGEKKRYEVINSELCHCRCCFPKNFIAKNVLNPIKSTKVLNFIFRDNTL